MVVPPGPVNKPPPLVAVLPLSVQSVTVVVPSFSRPPPFPVVEPPEIVRPLKLAVAPLSTWNTPTSPPPLTVTLRSRARDRFRRARIRELQCAEARGKGDHLRRGKRSR